MPALPPGGAPLAGGASETNASGYAEDTKQDPQLTALAGRFKKRLKYFSGQMQECHVERWKRNRKHVNGEEGEDGEKGLVRVNLIASVVNTIQPNIYAKSPEVSVRPEERVNPAEYGGLRDFARTLELALNKYAIRDTQLKARGKEAVRTSLTCTTGWVKVVYQKDFREDPLIRNRINDVQDNIQRIEQLLRETKDEAQGAQYEANMAELRQTVAGLEQQVEVVHADGLVIDNLLSEHVLVLDNSVRTIDEYAQASAIAHGIYMTCGAYKAQFGGKAPPKKATRYGNGDSYGTDDATGQQGGKYGSTTGIDADDELVLVWEIWSKDDQTVYTLCDGADEFCRDPYQPERMGQQWYPFFPLQLWRVSGYLYARALVDNLIELVDEYNTRRTTAAEHRRKNLPVRLLNTASGISNEQIDRINNRGATTDIIGVSADPQSPLANQLGSLPEIPYNPAMYDTSDILRDVEMVSGAQDASRGGVNQAKTATEAEIMAMGMQSRTAEQLDTIEEWLTAILIYCAQLLLMNKSPAEIKQAFGEDAIWPELSKEQMFEQVQVQIRAGSTAKPNKMRERDQWLQFLPQLQNALAQIAELRKGGDEDMAQAMIKVLDETLRRFDERLSIKEFIPGMGEDGEAPPGQGAEQMMQQGQAKLQEMMQQAQEVLQQREQATQQGEQDLQRQATELQVKQIGFDAQQQVAATKSSYAARSLKLDAQEIANDTVNKVTELLERHEERVKQAIDAGTPPPLEPEIVIEQVHAVLAPGLAAMMPADEVMPNDPM